MDSCDDNRKELKLRTRKRKRKSESTSPVSTKKGCDTVKINSQISLPTDDVDKQTTEEESEPKLTRAKAQALNKKILNLPPLNAPKPTPEVEVLIREELKSDDEDEEYQPCEDDIPSDDDHNTTISDIDSISRTPYTPRPLEDLDTPQKYTNDGIFKIPLEKYNSNGSITDQDCLIAQRTRSKISLETIPIETIESSFYPPDIPCDLLHQDQDFDMDNNWLEFLNVLSKPLNHSLEDDDEADPEYVAADQIPVDKEELRDVNISKKEFNDMIEELMLGLEDVDFDQCKPLSEISSTTKTKANKPAIKPRKSKSSLENNPSETQSNILGEQYSTTLPNAPILGETNNLLQQSSVNVVTTDSHYQLSIPLDSLNPYNGAVIQNGTIHLQQYQQVIVFVPTIDIINHQQKECTKPLMNDDINQEKELTTRITTTDNNDIESNVNATNLNDNEKDKNHENVRITTRYQRKLFKHLESEVPTPKIVNALSSNYGFTTAQNDILEQQLRMHIQLATQSFSQLYRHPVHLLYAVRFKNIVLQLNEQLKDVNFRSKIVNLISAINFMNEWEKELDPPNLENLSYQEFIKKEFQRYLRSTEPYNMVFHQRYLERITNSPVFMYSNILPVVPFQPVRTTRRAFFLPVEDYLIAHGIQRFYNKRRKMTREQRRQRVKQISVNEVCHEIAKHFFYTNLKRKALYMHVMGQRMVKNKLNPIQYYFLHKKAPAVHHDLKSIDLNNIVCPKSQSLGDLPYVWAEYIKKILAIDHDKRLNPNDYPSGKSLTSSSMSLGIEYKANRTNEPKAFRTENTFNNCQSQQIPIQITINYNDTFTSTSNGIEQYNPVECRSSKYFNEQRTDGLIANRNIQTHSLNLYNVNSSNQIYETNQYPCELITTKSSNENIDLNVRIKYDTDKNDGQQTLLTRYFPRQNLSCFPLDQHQSIENNIVLDESNNYNKNDKSFSQSTKELHQKLYLILKHFNSYKSTAIIHFGKEKQLLVDIYNSLKSLEIYINLVYDFEMSTAVKRFKQNDDSKKSKNDESITSVDTTDKQQVDLNCSNMAAKRSQKACKLTDNTRLIMLPENKEDSNEKDFIFAQNFMDRVAETYRQEDKLEKFDDFQDILRAFDPSEEKVVDLFYKLEKLFLPDHPELAEIFLTFLMPGQAAQVGKFIEHFMLTNMSNFVNKLNIFFYKQPAQIKKVFACFKELSNEEDLKMEQIKTKVLPLLKGNQLLTEWFLQCFPNEQYPESSLNEYESLSLRKAIETIDEQEVYEYLPQTDIMSDPIDNPCHLKYMNGRVYYGNRFLLPGKLSFVNGNVNLEQLNDAISGQSNDGSLCDNTNGYRCVHSIKQYGDAKIKESQKESNQMCVDDATGTSDEQRRIDIIKNEEKTIANETLIPSHLGCNDITLKAHAIRLNPSVYASDPMTSKDAERILQLGCFDSEGSILDRETMTKSPKKSTNRISLTASSKSQRRQSPKSPNSKKIPNRPTVNKKSPAIQMAKKLRKIITTNVNGDDTKSPSTSVAKMKRKKYVSINRQKSIEDAENEHQLSLGGIKQEKSHEELLVDKTECSTITKSQILANIKKSNINDGDSIVDNSTIKSETPLDWSREEDKMLLEHIKLGGFLNEIDLVKNVETKLPDRSPPEIYDRFKFLMDVIATIRNDS